MSKKILLGVVVALLIVGLGAYTLSARTPGMQGGSASQTSRSDIGSSEKSAFMNYDQQDLVGGIVTDGKGRLLGLINRLQIDSQGRSFAVINHGSYSMYGEGGAFTPVPIAALKHSGTESGLPKFVLNKTEKQLQAAPAYNPLPSATYQAKIFTFYGLPETGCVV